MRRGAITSLLQCRSQCRDLRRIAAHRLHQALAVVGIGLPEVRQHGLAGLDVLHALQVARQVVAPTPDKVGPPLGENIGDYNITQSYELGYRFNSVSGDDGQYRSTVNYGNGIRLLGSSLTVNSKDGHGNWFDEILLNTLGLGNDPYQSATLRAQKNGLYQYNMTCRSQI